MRSVIFSQFRDNGVTIAERHSSGVLPTGWHDANNKDKGSANENDKFLYNTEGVLFYLD